MAGLEFTGLVADCSLRARQLFVCVEPLDGWFTYLIFACLLAGLLCIMPPVGALANGCVVPIARRLR